MTETFKNAKFSNKCQICSLIRWWHKKAKKHKKRLEMAKNSKKARKNPKNAKFSNKCQVFKKKKKFQQQKRKPNFQQKSQIFKKCQIFKNRPNVNKHLIFKKHPNYHTNRSNLLISMLSKLLIFAAIWDSKLRLSLSL